MNIAKIGYRKIIKIILLLSVIISCLITIHAWSDFTQKETNVFKGNVDMTSVVLYKKEKTMEGKITTNVVKNAQFKLFEQVSDTERVQIGGIYFTDDKGQIRVDNLPPGNYYFQEDDPGYGYMYDKGDNDLDIKFYDFTITEEDAKEEKLIEVEAYNRRIISKLDVTKQVLVAPNTLLPNSEKDREFVFTIHFSNGRSYPYVVDSGSEQNLMDHQFKLKNGQTAHFLNVPVGVTYEIKEEPVEYYYTSSINSQGSIMKDEIKKAVFYNQYDSSAIPITDVTIEVEKIVEGNIPEADKNKEFWFTFEVAGSEPVRFSLKNGETKEFVVPAGTTYHVMEDDYFGDSYLLSSVIGGSGTATGILQRAVFTNIYVGRKMVTIEGTKYWDLSNAPEGMELPSSIEIYLKNKSTGNIEQIKIVRPDDDKNWKYTFIAPERDSLDNIIEYEIDERAITNYHTTINGYDITNTYVEAARVDIPVVNKKITGDTPKEVSGFRFKLKGLAGAPMPEGTAGNEKIITITGEGESDFGTIAYSQVGTFSYVITELSDGINGYTYDDTVYTLTVVITQQDGKLVVQSTNVSGGSRTDKLYFENVYKTPDETTEMVEVKGQKIWIHGDNTNIPTGIMIRIKNGEETVISEYITEERNWQWTFKLPKYDKDNKLIKYTITEDEVDGYNTYISGYVITNIHQSADPEGPGDEGSTIIGGNKTWDHGDIDDEYKPKSITINVKNGNEIVATKETSAKEGWFYAFRVPKYENGKEINYTIEEENVEYYTAVYQGMNITNTFVDMQYPGDKAISTVDNTSFGWWFMVLGLTSIVGYRMYRKKKKY